jgi:uncharacterized HAD superfamily protein
MRVIAIDIDGTALAHPQKVNNLFNKKDTVIILHTSRPEMLREKTVRELQDAGIKYDALVMEKLKADFYIDDKSADFELNYNEV